MLKVFRHKNVARIVLWGILILILPAFVMWGTGSTGRSSKEKGPTFVGMINNKKVSFDDFAGSLRAVQCQIMLNYFNNSKVLGEVLKNKALMGKLAWDRIIMEREAARYKTKVSDKEVIAYIESHPIFSRNGRFDDRIYGYILRNNLGLEPRAFEELVRESLKIQKMHLILTKDIAITGDEVKEYYKNENEKYKIAYVAVTEENYKEIDDLIKNGKMSFEAAAAKLGMKPQETNLFSRSDYIDGIGEATAVVGAASKLKKGEVSGPIETRRGTIVFKVLSSEGYSEEEFDKKKAEYEKKALEEKKNRFLEGWLRTLELAATLKIDLGDYDKYYK